MIDELKSSASDFTNDNAFTADNASANERMKTHAAAAYLGVGTSTLEKTRLTGDGPPYIKLGVGKGARVVYERSDLDDWMAAMKRRSTSEAV